MSETIIRNVEYKVDSVLLYSVENGAHCYGIIKMIVHRPSSNDAFFILQNMCSNKHPLGYITLEETEKYCCISYSKLALHYPHTTYRVAGMKCLVDKYQPLDRNN